MESYIFLTMCLATFFTFVYMTCTVKMKEGFIPTLYLFIIVVSGLALSIGLFTAFPVWEGVYILIGIIGSIGVLTVVRLMNIIDGHDSVMADNRNDK